MIAARQIAFGKAAGAKWVNPYITDGLIAMWDGEWNAGGGEHDAALGTCQNLVGNGVLVGTVFDNSFFVASTLPIIDIDTSSNMTIEWCYPDSGVDRLCNLATANSLGKLRYLINDVRAGYAHYQIRYWKNGGQVSVYPIVKTIRQGAISFGDGLFKVYGNGAWKASYEANNPSDSKVFIVAGKTSFNNIRVYSSCLTAEEIAHNYKVDKARFGL
jgi:hypothetical protein